MLFAKLVLAYCVFLVLLQLLSGKAYGVGGVRILKRRLSERPGQRVWWGPLWIYKEEWPEAWWVTLIFNCVLIIGLVLGILGKLPKLPRGKALDEILVRLPIFQSVGGLIAAWVVWNLCRVIWRPSRGEPKLLGIGSLRTVSMYVAALLSGAVIAILNRRFRLGLWIFVPYTLLVLGRLSSQIDSGHRPTISRPRF
jgi:hypothetical protein